jgi:acetylornithine deacetylase/succinyl-diaminopimelate desuccinylase-like protein
VSSKAIAFARNDRNRFLDELKALLRIPSISTLPENRKDVRRTAELLAAELTRIGMEHAELIEVSSPESGETGHPLVLADWLHAPGAVLRPL